MTDQLAFRFTAEIVPFPASRMRGRLRNVASFILAKPEGKRGWHFKNQVGRVWDDAKRQRLPDHIARDLMREFSVALTNEMRRQQINAILIEDGVA